MHKRTIATIADMDVTEEDPIPFHFEKRMLPGDSLSEIEVNVFVYEGSVPADHDPQTLKSGAYQVQNGVDVVQLFVGANGIENVIYLIQATARALPSNRKITIPGLLRIVDFSTPET